MVQIKLTKVITEISIAATLGIGYMLAKHKFSKVRSDFDDYTEISQTNLPNILIKFKMLEHEEFKTLVDMIEDFLVLSKSILESKASNGSQFKLNRYCESIIHMSEHICHTSKYSKNDNIVTYAMDCERDEVEMLKAFCDNIVRNTLLEAL